MQTIYNCIFAQSAGAVEYANYGSADPPPNNECPGYNTKQSGGEVLIMLGALGNVEHPFIDITPRSTLARNGSAW